MQLERSTTSTWRSPSLPLPPSTGAPLGTGNGPGSLSLAVGGVVDRQLALAGADDRVGEAVGARRAEVGVEEVAAVGVDVGDRRGRVAGDRRLGDVLVPGGLGRRGRVRWPAVPGGRVGEDGAAAEVGVGADGAGASVAPIASRRQREQRRGREPAQPTLTPLWCGQCRLRASLASERSWMCEPADLELVDLSRRLARRSPGARR